MIQMSMHDFLDASVQVFPSQGFWYGCFLVYDGTTRLPLHTRACASKESAIEEMFRLTKVISDSVMRVQLEESVKDKEATLIANGSESI
jgi:hypothetical protein